MKLLNEKDRVRQRVSASLPRRTSKEIDCGAAIIDGPDASEGEVIADEIRSVPH
jgi:hypothetical protein